MFVLILQIRLKYCQEIARASDHMFVVVKLSSSVDLIYLKDEKEIHCKSFLTIDIFRKGILLYSCVYLHSNVELH